MTDTLRINQIANIACSFTPRVTAWNADEIMEARTGTYYRPLGSAIVATFGSGPWLPCVRTVEVPAHREAKPYPHNLLDPAVLEASHFIVRLAPVVSRAGVVSRVDIRLLKQPAKPELWRFMVSERLTPPQSAACNDVDLLKPATGVPVLWLAEPFDYADATRRQFWLQFRSSDPDMPADTPDGAL